jgi:hypothetical protein
MDQLLYLTSPVARDCPSTHVSTSTLSLPSPAMQHRTAPVIHRVSILYLPRSDHGEDDHRRRTFKRHGVRVTPYIISSFVDVDLVLRMFIQGLS